MSELDYKPAVHPYIAANELDMYPYFDALVAEGFIRVANYDDFLYDDEDKKLYESYFIDIHNGLREYLDAVGGKKQLGKLVLSQRVMCLHIVRHQ